MKCALLASCVIVLAAVPLARVLPQDSGVTAVTRSNTELAVDLYNGLSGSGGNLFFSPYSISTILAMAHAGARGETAEQIARVMHLSLADKELHAALGALQSMLNGLQEEGQMLLRVESSLWPQRRYPLLNEYRRLVGTSYGAEITPVDYENRAQAALRSINSWVTEKTEGKITEILRDTPPDSTRLILANAVYFKGAWVHRFDRRDTITMPFHLREGTTVVAGSRWWSSFPGRSRVCMAWKRPSRRTPSRRGPGDSPAPACGSACRDSRRRSRPS